MALNLMMTDDEQLRPRITVFGVGGAGGNAVNNMIDKALDGVEFVVANTDAQALAQSRARHRIQMGLKKTEGLGAGANPAIGAAAAEETIEDIVDHLMGAHMCFITAGMGGGTGTGAAPIIAQAAREMGILTVGVVTKPFQFEGQKRMRQAEAGIDALQKVVDTLIIIPNQNLFRLANERTTFTEAFAMADDVLHQGVKGVTDLMVRPGLINLDFADVRAVMDEMGKAMMGTGEASGENRAVQAAEKAIANPLLDEISLNGAKGVLINITGGPDMTLFELDEAANIIRDKVDPDANIIVGSTLDESMSGALRVSVVATGIDAEAATLEVPHPRRRMTEPLTHTPSLGHRDPLPMGAEADELPVPPRRVPAEPARTAARTEARAEPRESLRAEPRMEARAEARPEPRAPQRAAAVEEMPEPAYRPASEAPRVAETRPAAARLNDDAGSFTAPARPAAGQPSAEVLERLAAAVSKPAGAEGRPAPRAAAPAAPAAAPAGPGQGRMGRLTWMLERMSGAAAPAGADEAERPAGSLAERIGERMASRRAHPAADEFDGIDEPQRASDPVEIPAFLRRQAN